MPGNFFMNKIFFTAIFVFSSLASFSQSKIPADSAYKHIGETLTICSTVYGVKAMEKVTFINLGSAYPNAPLTLVIFTKDLGNFSDTPQKLYNNKSICVTGIIKEYKGKAEIIVSKQDQIKVK
jgi:DNA/RNA endonuclease YhcR with UshA esterase domain